MTGRTPARETFWNPERTAEFTALFAEGLSYRMLAERLGCSKNAVIGKAKRLGIVRREGPAPRTLHDRMDAEHVRMDAVLVESNRGRVA